MAPKLHDSQVQELAEWAVDVQRGHDEVRSCSLALAEEEAAG